MLCLATKFTKTSFAKAGVKVVIEIESDNDSIERDPNCCAVKAMVENSMQLKTVAQILKKPQDMHIIS